MATTSSGTAGPASEPVIVLGIDVRSITDARERLLFAGLHVFMNARADLVIGGLQPDIVAAVADRSRRNFYDHFESKEAFVTELFQRFLCDSDLLTGIGAKAEEPQVTDFRSVVKSWFSPSVLESIEVIGALTGAVLWAPTNGGSDTLTSILADHNQMFDEYYEPRYEAFLQSWEMALVPGWTPLQLATVVRGATDGFVMRFRPSTGGFTEDHLDLLVATVIGVFATAVIDVGDPGLIGSSSASSLADRLGDRLASAVPTTVTVDARRALRSVFLEDLKDHPIEELSLPYLAHRAGIATSTALRVSGSVKELARSVFDDFVTSFESSLEESAAEPAHDRVGAHLQRVARFGFQYGPLIRCYGAYLPKADAGDLDPGDRLVRLLAPILEQAPGPVLREGLLSGDVDAEEAARFMTLPFLLPLNQASSPSRSDFSEEIARADRMVDAMLRLYLAEPSG